MLGLSNSLTSGVVLSSDFEPSDLGSTLLVWYKNATGITSLSGTDGNSDNRFQWADQSGGSRHAYQDTDADKPEESNGGMDFVLSETDHMLIAAGDGAIDFGYDSGTPANGTFTIIVAVNRRTHAAANQLLASTGTEFLGFASSDDKVKFRGSSASASALTFATSNLWTSGADFILTVTKDGSGNLLCYKNSDFQAESGGGTSQNQGTDCDLTILGAQDGAKNFDGVMYEVIVCDTVLSDYDRSSAITYLKDKFSIE